MPLPTSPYGSLPLPVLWYPVLVPAPGPAPGWPAFGQPAPEWLASTGGWPGGPSSWAPGAPSPAQPAPGGPLWPRPAQPWPGPGPVWPPAAGDGQGPPAGAPAHVIPAKAAWWGLLGAAVGFVLATILEGVALAATGQSSVNSSDSALLTVLGEVGLWTAMVGTAVLVSRRYGTRSLRRDFGLSFRPADLGWGMLAMVTGLVASSIVVAAFAHTRFAGSNAQIVTGQKGHEVGLVAIAVVVAVGAPFFEELFFRGFLRTALQARLGGHGAVWAQAGLFALAHLGEAGGLGNVSVVCALFLFGAVLGYTAKLTGRLGAGMVAHGMFNLIAVIAVI